MAVMGLDIGKIVKWGALLIGIIAIILFLKSWRDQGVEITRLENTLKTTQEDLKDAEDQLKENTRITDAATKANETRENRKEDSNTAFDAIADEFSERVRQERDAELRNLPSEPPELSPGLVSIPPTEIKTPPVKLEAETTPLNKPTPTKSTPTPAAEKISQLAIDAAWASYCQALDPKPEECL